MELFWFCGFWLIIFRSWSCGRKKPRLLYSKSIQHLNYDKGTFEPDFERGYFKKYNSASEPISTGGQKNSGYDYIQKYHIKNHETSVNNYKTKYADNVLGIGTGHVSLDNRTDDDKKTSSEETKAYSIWASKGNRLGVYNRGLQPIKKASLILAGITKVHERDVTYFNLVQPYQHHTNIPAPGINVYSFALDPEEHQPSGSCNFANLRGINLEIELTQTTNDSHLPQIPSDDSNKPTTDSYEMNLYAVCYNVFRIMSGIGALAYSS